MKVKRILSLILSLCLVLTGVVSVSLAESSEEPEGALESDNELSVIMEDEAEILLSAASEDEPDEDVPPDEDEEEPVEDESDPVEDADSADEDIPDDDAEEPDEPEDPVEEPMEDPADEPVEEPAEEPSEISEDLTPVPTGITLDEPVEEPAEEPSEEPVEEPADEPVEAPVEEPIEEPAEEPVEEPESADPAPEIGDDNETEMSGGFTPAGSGEARPETGTAPATGPDAAVSFRDVAADGWYAEAVLKAASKGIMNGMGDGTFAPQANLTRAMLVQILYNLEGRPAVSGGAAFGDVAPGAWYSPAVAWAAGEKLVEGYAGNYDPLADITREQLVTVLWRYARWKGAAASGGSLEGFADAAEVSSWATDAMGWAVGVGLLKGRTADTLAPRGEATRAEVATLMLRFTALTDT